MFNIFTSGQTRPLVLYWLERISQCICSDRTMSNVQKCGSGLKIDNFAKMVDLFLCNKYMYSVMTPFWCFALSSNVQDSPKAQEPKDAAKYI